MYFFYSIIQNTDTMPEATEMQTMEMDMIQGMYDTYELISSDPPSYSILLTANNEDTADLRVTICYPTEDYPESAPCEVTVENISRKRRIPLAELTTEVNELCLEHVGMHSVVVVLQHIQDFISRFVADEERLTLQRRGEAAEAAAAAYNYPTAPDPTITVGSAMTRELFEEWSRKHRLEVTQTRLERNKREARATASRLTGRQLWDSTLKTADWELFAADGEEGGVEDVDFGAMNSLDEANYDLDECEGYDLS